MATSISQSRGVCAPLTPRLHRHQGTGLIRHRCLPNRHSAIPFHQNVPLPVVRDGHCSARLESVGNPKGRLYDALDFSLASGWHPQYSSSVNATYIQLQLHLDVIAGKVSPGAQAIVILDQAGWHGAKDLRVPTNLSLLPLPPRSPELNGQENVWQFVRQNWLSNRVFQCFDDIVGHCCDAWNRLVNQPWRIISLGMREWAHR